jgi:hypothetical protein
MTHCTGHWPVGIIHTHLYTFLSTESVVDAPENLLVFLKEEASWLHAVEQAGNLEERPSKALAQVEQGSFEEHKQQLALISTHL